MMNFLYDLNLNIGVTLMLVMCFGMAIGTLLYAVGWLIVETIRKRKAEWNVTATETGVGVVESAERSAELEAWAELVNILDFGGQSDV